MLQKEETNVYRNLFGITGDGVVELMTYFSVMLPRREAINKQYISNGAGMTPIIKLDHITNLFNACNSLYCGRDL